MGVAVVGVAVVGVAVAHAANPRAMDDTEAQLLREQEKLFAASKAKLDAKQQLHQLHRACYLGRVDAMRLWLDRGLDVNQGMRGVAPLHVASGEGHVEAVRLLLDRGADVDRETHEGVADLPGGAVRTTALIIACQEGHVDTAKLLLDRGADVNRVQQGFASATALWLACRNGNVEVATLCLDRGADVDRASERGYFPGGATPLWIACRRGHVETARLCLDRGAAVERTAEVSLHTTLPPHTTPVYDTPLQTTMTPLQAAAGSGISLARLLLERGADINRATPEGLTPVEIARQIGNTSLRFSSNTKRLFHMADWLERIAQVSWKRHLSEPRYALVVLRALAARGDARLPGRRLPRRQRADKGKEHVLDFLFPGDLRRREPRLPDDLFPLVIRYYWGGGLSAKEEAFEALLDRSHREEMVTQARVLARAQ